MSAVPFHTLTAVAVPLLRSNIDTDAIIPSREIKGVSKKGLSDGLFAGWRYTAVGSREPDPEFVLNKPEYRDAQILLAGENFGCGSSREHAAWALAEYGFRAVIAASFSPIFRGNCVRNGIVPVVLDAPFIEVLAVWLAPEPQKRLVTVDLQSQIVLAAGHKTMHFEIGAEAKDMLFFGLDGIDLTLRRRAKIQAFREADAQRRPWAYLQETT